MAPLISLRGTFQCNAHLYRSACFSSPVWLWSWSPTNGKKAWCSSPDGIRLLRSLNALHTAILRKGLFFSEVSAVRKVRPRLETSSSALVAHSILSRSWRRGSWSPRTLATRPPTGAAPIYFTWNNFILIIYLSLTLFLSHRLSFKDKTVRHARRERIIWKYYS